MSPLLPCAAIDFHDAAHYYAATLQRYCCHATTLMPPLITS